MVESVPATSVFISYRRDDAGGHAGRLFDHLVTRLGSDRVFMDIDAIAPGADFVAEIARAIESCHALVAVIGRRWLETTAEGTQRLDDPEDFVRLEIATALTHGVSVFPILVDGGTMPSPAQLPDEIRSLARRNAIVIDNVHWTQGVERLMAAIRPRMWLIVIIDGRPSEVVEIAKAPFLIGRGDDCDLVLGDETVSRRHATITPAKGIGRNLRDLGSANGTLVNGRPMKPAPGFTTSRERAMDLYGGEILQFGDTVVSASLIDPRLQQDRPGLEEDDSSEAE